MLNRKLCLLYFTLGKTLTILNPLLVYINYCLIYFPLGKTLTLLYNIMVDKNEFNSKWILKHLHELLVFVS